MTNTRAKNVRVWDCETITEDDGSQRVVIWGTEDTALVRPGGVKPEEMIEYLVEHAQPKDINLIFHGKLDITLIIAGLLDDEGRTHLANGDEVYLTTHRKIAFRCISGKMYSFRYADELNTPNVRLDDFGSYFPGQGLVAAATTWLGDTPELPIVAEGKAKRGQNAKDFTTADLDAMVHYHRAEQVLARKLAERLIDMVAQLGYEPQYWYGPGAVASTVLDTHKIQSHLSTDRLGHWLGSQAGHYGRFENRLVGAAQGPFYTADINSAYPSAIADLPSLRAAEWLETDDDKQVGFHLVRWLGTDRSALQGVPYRKDGQPLYPMGATSWIWDDEYRALLDTVPEKITRLTGYVLKDYATRERPFAFVREMYTKRAEWKFSGDPRHLAAKLILNSLFGKMTQTVGAVVKTRYVKIPTFSQPEYSAMITSRARAQIWRAIHQAQRQGAEVVAVETDSICTTQRLDLPYSKALGDWDVEECQSLIYIQSGYSFRRVDGTWKVKSRGIEKDSQDPTEILRYLSQISNYRDEEIVEGPKVPTKRFISFTATGRHRVWGLFVGGEREIRVGSNKRRHERCPACETNTPMSEGMHTTSALRVVGLSEGRDVPWMSPELIDKLWVRSWPKRR